MQWKYRERIVKGKTRRERVYLVPCPHCGSDRWLKKCDADNAVRTGSVCVHCSTSQKGRKGFQATFGHPDKKRAAFLGIQAHLKGKPSNLETLTTGLLEGMPIAFEFNGLIEHRGEYYLVDFLAGNLVIEVDGEYYHSMNGRAASDARKREALRVLGFRVLILSEDDLKSGRAVELLARFLNAEAVAA